MLGHVCEEGLQPSKVRARARRGPAMYINRKAATQYCRASRSGPPTKRTESRSVAQLLGPQHSFAALRCVRGLVTMLRYSELCLSCLGQHGRSSTTLAHMKADSLLTIDGRYDKAAIMRRTSAAPADGAPWLAWSRCLAFAWAKARAPCASACTPIPTRSNAPWSARRRKAWRRFIRASPAGTSAPRIWRGLPIEWRRYRTNRLHQTKAADARPPLVGSADTALTNSVL